MRKQKIQTEPSQAFAWTLSNARLTYQEALAKQGQDVVMRALKIIAAIIASQCALGFVVGFTCPWIGFYLMRIGDLQTLLAWSVATVLPFGFAIDGTAVLAGIGLSIWRKRYRTMPRGIRSIP